MNDDDLDRNESTNSLLHTFGMNLISFIILMIAFEFIRHLKAIHLKRVTRKLQQLKKIPPIPSAHFLSWISCVMKVSDSELLRMVGLDGYMLIRYIQLCFRASVFFSFFGLVVLLPLYHSFTNNHTNTFIWKNVTISAIQNDTEAHLLWFPVCFAYIFSGYMCYLLYFEYKHFYELRTSYIRHGDIDTPIQTYYTVMVESIPTSLQSAPHLKQFFEKIFPDQVFSVEICLDLHDLDDLIKHRSQVRDTIEKSIANWHATGVRPKMKITKEDLEALLTDEDTVPTECTDGDDGWLSSLFPKLIEKDAIDYYSKLLDSLNDSVYRLQELYVSKAMDLEDALDLGDGAEDLRLLRDLSHKYFLGSDPHMPLGRAKSHTSLSNKLRRDTSASREFSGTGQPVSIEGLAREGLKSARRATEMATREAIRGVMAVTRSIELLTVGASYRTSSTAFVTFTSRVAKSGAHQMVLSHQHFAMSVKPAPNPNDVIWSNVSIPRTQIQLRRQIADITLIGGALLWSVVVGFITAISNIEMLSMQLTWLRAIRGTLLYKVLNDYLAVGILLMLLTALPHLFDFIARNYECLKRESEIQNSIMSRYFYYQLANVFVSVGLGSIVNSLYEIIQYPQSIFSILGNNLPSFSMYFASLIIIKSLTAVPLELMRIVPLIEIYFVKLFIDKKKCTRRELRSGAFADRPILYGWVYPNLLMVLMILLTYCCIAPLLMPLGALYFALAYLMYKYQLLYVFINDYQSGGFMWYAVFSRSVVAMVCGSMTLLGYVGIHMTQYTSCFYSLVPLPLALIYFWWSCRKHFQHKTNTLALEDAVELDRKNLATNEALLGSFKRALYCQPSLVEGELAPSPYRRPTSASFASPDFTRTPHDDVEAEMTSVSSARQQIDEYDEEVEKELHLSELIDLISPMQLTNRENTSLLKFTSPQPYGTV